MNVSSRANMLANIYYAAIIVMILPILPFTSVVVISFRECITDGTALAPRYDVKIQRKLVCFL